MATHEKKLKAQAEAHRLVGSYIQTWNMMEKALADCLIKGLHLGDLEGAVLIANTSFREKISILRSLVSISVSASPDREKFDKILDSVQRSSKKRNIIVHNAFWPDRDGAAVRFDFVKATEYLSFPPTVFSRRDFEAEERRLMGFRDNLGTISQSLSREPLVKALLARQPKPELGGIGLLGLLGLHWQDEHHSNPPEATHPQDGQMTATPLPSAED